MKNFLSTLVAAFVAVSFTGVVLAADPAPSAIAPAGAPIAGDVKKEEKKPCDKCRDLKKSKDCKDCKDCRNYKKCTDGRDCGKCTDCKKGKECMKCKNCSRCDNAGKKEDAKPVEAPAAPAAK